MKKSNSFPLSKQTETDKITMGVKNLWDLLESCKKTLPLHHLQNKRVCIDLSCWMVQLQNVNRSCRPQTDKLYLRGLFHRLRALIALNCSLIFVADGSIPAIKLSTYRRRLNSGPEATQDDKNLDKVSSLRRNMGSEFSRMIKEARALGLALGVPCLDGIEEAEAQCALLNLESLCDGCFSSDSDIFLFGARTVYRDICLGEGGHVVCYEMADIEKKHGFGRASMITLALLLGSDYSQGVHGVGPESACQIVKSVGEDVVLQRIASEGLSFVKKAKNSKKDGHFRKCNSNTDSMNREINVNGSDHSSERENQFLPVIDAYSNPKCHSADSEAVRRVLTQHPFQRARLHQICAQFFEWPPEKTDEYILPKIAERDLQRLANLRLTSSELGVELSLQKLSVKCPVMGIIKRRKLQGKECFEVSWEELYGLKSSVVHADLIESACPEKIVEFENRRAQAKPKKSKPRSSAAEIDQKLQALLLDIESESRTIPNASFSSRAAVMLEDRTAAETAFKRQYQLLDAESEVNADGNSTMPCYPNTSTLAKNEIIDLVSPSPVQSRNISKTREMKDQFINAIELSDSETESSPEHERKARELRLFIASIRDDIP